MKVSSWAFSFQNPEPKTDPGSSTIIDLPVSHPSFHSRHPPKAALWISIAFPCPSCHIIYMEKIMTSHINRISLLGKSN